ncbi:hypothetical protein B0H13DRAFT_2283382 [Mycena leptocephala]|nr:hypothetical protein B0H13DRAFT_2283382 [Mycena leptocephala]
MCLIHHLVAELVLLLRVDLDAGRKGRVVAAEMVVVVEGGEGALQTHHHAGKALQEVRYCLSPPEPLLHWYLALNEKYVLLLKEARSQSDSGVGRRSEHISTWEWSQVPRLLTSTSTLLDSPPPCYPTLESSNTIYLSSPQVLGSPKRHKRPQNIKPCVLKLSFSKVFSSNYNCAFKPFLLTPHCQYVVCQVWLSHRHLFDPPRRNTARAPFTSKQVALTGLMDPPLVDPVSIGKAEWNGMDGYLPPAA